MQPLGRRVARWPTRRHGVDHAERSCERARRSPTTPSTRGVRAGWLHRVHRGVYAVGRPTLTTQGRFLAAVLSCGPGAALSHVSAAVLWGAAPGARPAHRRDRRQRGGQPPAPRAVIVHRSRASRRRRHRQGRHPGHHARPHAARPRRRAPPAPARARPRRGRLPAPRPRRAAAARRGRRGAARARARARAARRPAPPARAPSSRSDMLGPLPLASACRRRRSTPRVEGHEVDFALARGAPDRRDRRLGRPRHPRRVRARSAPRRRPARRRLARRCGSATRGSSASRAWVAARIAEALRA